MTVPESFREDMRQAGLTVDGPWDLVRLREPYGAAIPALISWLDRAESEVPDDQRARFREGIVRSLAVREARGLAGEPLLREFRRKHVSPFYRWAVGNSLSVIADDSLFASITQLARDTTYGRAREMLPIALARMTTPDAVDVLIQLLDDQQVAGHAIIALGRLRAQKARALIEARLDDPTPWIRREARKSLKRLDSGQRSRDR